MGKHSKTKKSKRKHRKSSSSSESDASLSKEDIVKALKRKRRSSDSSTSSIDDKLAKKVRKELKKIKKKQKRKKDKKRKKEKPEKYIKATASTTVNQDKPSYDVDISLMEKSKLMAPMTKEEWDKKQNSIRRVYDEDSGRSRLVRGDGEILEECVSRERHIAINKQSTKADGDFFQKTLNKSFK